MRIRWEQLVIGVLAIAAVPWTFFACWMRYGDGAFGHPAGWFLFRTLANAAMSLAVSVLVIGLVRTVRRAPAPRWAAVLWMPTLVVASLVTLVHALVQERLLTTRETMYRESYVIVGIWIMLALLVGVTTWIMNHEWLKKRVNIPAFSLSPLVPFAFSFGLAAGNVTRLLKVWL